MPPQTSTLLETLKHVEILGHQQCDPLEIFHLYWPINGGLAYSTLYEALDARSIEVTESTEAGQVSPIKTINRSEQMVFLMAGEQPVGRKQTRVVNSSITVPAHTEMPWPVSCVERRRWGYSSATFSSAHTSSHYALRSMVSAQASKGYRRAGTPSSDQAAVWHEVSRKLGVTGSPSSSDAIQDMFRKHELKLKELEEKLPAPIGCNGVA